MARLLCSDVSPSQCKRWRRFLAAFWLLGMIGGAAAARFQSPDLFPVMYRAPWAPGSIVKLLIAGILPFLLTFTAVWLSSAGLLLLICFLKAFAYAFTYCCTVWAFGSAGWLVQGLLLFGSGPLLPVLYALWHRHPPGLAKLERGEAFLLLCGALLAGSVNVRVISPFLAGLIEF